MKTVLFPLLHLKLHINRVAFSVPGKDVYLYGLILCMAFIIGLIICLRLIRNINIKEDDFLDLVIVIVPAGIIGARLYYVLFKIDYYIKNPLDIIKTWNGGLAIYGGIIGAALALIFFCRIKNIEILEVLDVIVIGLIIGQAIGRWGNFFNVEAYGYETNVPWRMDIYSNTLNKYIGVHPTFLYESIGNFIIFFILYKSFKSRKFHGFIASLYLILYGILRFFIEGLRADSLYFLNIKISQAVSLIFVIIGFLYIYLDKYRQKRLK